MMAAYTKSIAKSRVTAGVKSKATTVLGHMFARLAVRCFSIVRSRTFLVLFFFFFFFFFYL